MEFRGEGFIKRIQYGFRSYYNDWICKSVCVYDLDGISNNWWVSATGMLGAVATVGVHVGHASVAAGRVEAVAVECAYDDVFHSLKKINTK